MKYLLLIHGDESTMNTAPTVGDSGMSAEFGAFHNALAKSGAHLGGERLRPTTEARSVRVRDGKAVVLDGPYAETQEQLGGYYLIDVPDMDAALEWAKQCPSARGGTIEVRPVWPTRGA
ncbi:MAG TPA: YciI family protein [Devosia sp.]|nr:YciI family protein [Devosia sp.]